MKQRLLFLLVLLFVLSFKGIPQTDTIKETELYEWLKSIPDFEVKQIKADTIFTEAYEIMVTQPIDHNNPSGAKFKEQIFLSNTDKTKPMVINLDGYAVANSTTELSRILKCNQIVVEHRYCGESVPDPFDWKYLDFRQATADDHHIIELFKEYYKGKWISTGISKGGSTAIFHLRFYPDDVDVSVPYVGPINRSIEDQRVYEFIKDVSTQECRDKVEDFQILCFKKHDELYPMFLKNADDKELTYNIVGNEKAYEYSVLEYSFAYWQWGKGDCSKIPDSTSSIEAIFEHLNINGGFRYFDDASIKNNWPFFYQCYTNYGYYGYDITPFKDYLHYADGHTPFFIPEGVHPVFDPEPMQDVSNWVQNEAKNCIFIYGGNDPWSSTGVCLSGKTNSIKMVLPGGSHRTRIRSFSKKDKDLIYSKLEEWLSLKIDMDN
jgi:hypothetical protein